MFSFKFNRKNNSNLSKRANGYLRKLERNKNATCDKSIIIKYFEKHNFPLFDKFIEFETEFSGYTLEIEREEKQGDGRHQFYLELVTKREIEKNIPVDFFKVGENIWLSCGQHGTAPFGFSINQKGEIATSYDDEILAIIASSVEKFIEKYAINSEQKFVSEYYYKSIAEEEIVVGFLNQHQFVLIEECSDEYGKWYTNQKIIIDYSTNWDDDEMRLHLFSHNESELNIWTEKIQVLIKK